MARKKRLTIKETLEIIDKRAEGERMVKLCEEYSVFRIAIYKVVKNKKNIENIEHFALKRTKKSFF